MNAWNSFFNALLSPTVCLFCVLLGGLLIGKLRIGGVSLGSAGVLGAALLFGMAAGAAGEFPAGRQACSLYPAAMQTICSFLSSFGTSLFIAVIGLNAGQVFCSGSSARKWKAFFAGACVVLIGALTAGAIGIFSGLPRALVLGLFSGGMTSTPVLSAACELFPGDPLPATGYGMAYCIGLFSAVLFVQFMGKKVYRPVRSIAPDPLKRAGKAPPNSALPMLSTVILAGTLIGNLLTVGATGGILFVGIVTGMRFAKVRKALAPMNSLREFGLCLFLLGTGIPAGVALTSGINPLWLLYGAAIPFGAILIGYPVIRYGWRFSGADSLAILSGGMTSTPAIGALQSHDSDTDLTLYAMSYVGALLSLLISVRVLFELG